MTDQTHPDPQPGDLCGHAWVDAGEAHGCGELIQVDAGHVHRCCCGASPTDPTEGADQ